MTADASGHSARLRKRLSQPAVLKAPGVYDGLTALLAEQAGFECGFVSGAGIAFSRLGSPDIETTVSGELDYPSILAVGFRYEATEKLGRALGVRGLMNVPKKRELL